MAIRGLAIETSGREGSVAVVCDGEAVVAETFSHGLKHAAGLVPMIGRVLERAGLKDDAVDELYVSIGPGSFTGLRIAVTLAKTWWFARGTPVVAVPSVRAIVENLPGNALHAAVVLDAKRGQVFTASYSRDEAGEWRETRGARLDTVANVVATDPRPLVLTGEGLDYHKLPEQAPLVARACGGETPPISPWTDDAASVGDPLHVTEHGQDARATGGVTLAPRELWQAKAEVVGKLGHAMARRGEFADGMTLSPTYVRLAEAEEKWLAERKG